VSPGATRRARVGLAAVFLMVAVAAIVPAARAQGPRVLLAEISDAIDRATTDYVSEAIAEAGAGGYSALVIRFDTPGGELDATLAIARLMDNAKAVPILGWVGPVGAHAFSAGTILLVSTDLAAMAPGTTIGSVQPVVLGPGGFEPVTDEKIMNAVIGVLHEQMVLHGRDRNVTIGGQTMPLSEWFVRENLNLNATQAQSYGATELVASTVSAFLLQADGRTTAYKGLTLDVAGAEVVTFSASARVGLLSILSDPLISSLLLILGIYLIIFGLSAPGHGAEIAGIIVLLLALIGLGFSVDPIALFLIALGIVLIIIELKAPGFGAFGVGGIVAIAIGAIFLAPLRPPRFYVSPDYQLLFLISLLIPTAALGAFLLFALYKVLEIRRRTPTVGVMVGETATAVDPIKAGERGYVMYHGELWQAIPAEDLAPEQKVYIHAVDGIVLRVSTGRPPAPARRPSPVGLLRRLFRRKPA